MPALLVSTLLVLSVVAWVNDAATARSDRQDRGTLQAAGKLLDEARVRAEERLAAARYRKDAVAEAQARAVLDRLRLIERRSNLATVARQVQESYDSWSESEKREFILWASGMFNKWRLPAESAQAWWDAMEGISDFATIENARPATASEVKERVDTWLGVAEKRGPLPRQVGVYLTESIRAKLKQENPQIASLSKAEQEKFLCEQARKRVSQLVAAERDPARTEILRAAQATTEAACTALVASLPKREWKLVDGKPQMPPRPSGTGVSTWDAQAGPNGFSATQRKTMEFAGRQQADMLFAVQMTGLPSVLVPRSTVTVTVNATFKGFIDPAVAGPGGGPFQLRSQGVTLKGQTELLLSKKSAGGNNYSSEGSITASFDVPETAKEISVTALFFNCSGCGATWIYRPE